jgi:hypothetical protein
MYVKFKFVRNEKLCTDVYDCLHCTRSFKMASSGLCGVCHVNRIACLISEYVTFCIFELF